MIKLKEQLEMSGLSILTIGFGPIVMNKPKHLVLSE